MPQVAGDSDETVWHQFQVEDNSWASRKLQGRQPHTIAQWLQVAADFTFEGLDILHYGLLKAVRPRSNGCSSKKVREVQAVGQAGVEEVRRHEQQEHSEVAKEQMEQTSEGAEPKWGLAALSVTSSLMKQSQVKCQY